MYADGKDAFRTHPDAARIAVKHRRLAMFRKQRHLLRCPIALIENFNRLAPRCLPAIVDFTQIQHMPLHGSIP